MKNYSVLLILICLASFSVKGFSQTEDFLIVDGSFDYLIGKTYSEANELKDLSFNGRTSMIKDNLETSTTTFNSYGQYVTTTEIVGVSSRTNQKTYTIQDVLIFNKQLQRCEGCFSSNDQAFEIISFHPLKQKLRDSTILAFKRNRVSGLLTQVNYKSYSWNPNADLLDKN